MNTEPTHEQLAQAHEKLAEVAAIEGDEESRKLYLLHAVAHRGEAAKEERDAQLSR